MMPDTGGPKRLPSTAYCRGNGQHDELKKVEVGNCAAGVQRIYIRIESHEVMCTITGTISLDLPGNGTHCIYQRMQANPPEVTATLLEVTRKELYRKR